MTPAQIASVQTSFARALPHADTVSIAFYDRLFAADPGLRRLFADDLSEQRRKLMLTLALVVQQLHALHTILPTIHGLAQRHVGYGAKPHHYPLIGRALIEALAATLPGFTDAERDAWATAYGILAGEMLAAADQARTAA